MTSRVLIVLCALVAANCAPRLDDLRLDGLRPPQIGRIETLPGILAGTVGPVIVAELSTTRDLHLLEARHSNGSYVDVVLCRGRTHVTRQHARSDIVLSGHWRAEGDAAEPSRPRSAAAALIDGRYRYRVAIRLRQVARVVRIEGLDDRSFAEVDLMRDPVDLCLVIDSVHMGLRWRSNTVVIPAEAIRAATAREAIP